MRVVRVFYIALVTVALSGAAMAQAIFTTAPPSVQGLGTGNSGPAAAAQPQPLFARPAQLPSSPASSGGRPSAATDQFSRPSYAGAQPVAAPQGAQQSSSPGQVQAASAARGTEAGFIRHLTNNIQGFRLSGEVGSSEWPFYVTQTQARQHLRFQVGYIAAVSVMPEASQLTLVINDEIVGVTAIRSVSNVKTVTFDIPDGLVKPGFNSVRLAAEQRHRVDCSLQATYELWTQIDPSQTGLVMTRADVGVNNLGDLAALPPDAQGALPIRVIIPTRTSLSAIERVMKAVSLISLAGRFEQPTVDVGPIAEGEYGINLAVGPIAEIMQQTAINIGPVNGPRIAILPASAGRRTTIVVTGVTDEQVNLALNEFAIGAEKSGTTAGLRAAAAFPGYRLEGGQHVRLRDLGVASREFSGRLFRTGFNVIMPSDFYAADYDRVMLDLAGGYAPNLTNEAQVVVNVNGRNAVSLKLPKSSGDVFANNEVPLPLGYMRPGLNRIEIEAHVPTASDTACDPLAAMSGSKRFLLLDSTELALPRIARIARMPDLAVTATGGFPYVGGGARPKLYVPSPDRESIGSAATIAAHLSISAGELVNFQLTTVAPPAGSGATLVVGPATSIDKAILTGVGLSVEDITKSWQEKFTQAPVTEADLQLSRYEEVARNRLVLQKNFPAACHIGRPPKGFGRIASRYDRLATGAIPEDGPGNKLFAEWDSSVRNQNQLRAFALKSYGAVTGWARSKFFDATSWFSDRFEGDVQKPIMYRKASLVVAQNIIGANSDDVWTVVTAPNAGLLAESVECLVDPRVWRQVAGRMAVLDASEGTVKNAPVLESKLIATQPLSVGNVRLITAAWFSLNSTIFVGLVLMVALLLAAATHWFVSNVGRRSES